MIDTKEKLKIVYFNGSSYKDVSLKLAQFKDEFEEELELDIDKFLYVGFHKPITNFYINAKKTDSEQESEVLAEVYNGDFWVNTEFLDETFSFEKSGFVNFINKPTVKNEINGDELFWFRFYADDELSVNFHAISMLLCSVKDLEAIYPPIADEDFLLGKKSLHVAMEVSKNNILQLLRNRPVRLKDNRRLAVFDLLDVQEVRQAAAYKTVANVLKNNFNSIDDKFYVLSKTFEERAKELLELYFLTLDYADDGNPEIKSRHTVVRELRR